MRFPPPLLNRPSVWVSLFLDVALASLAYMTSYWLRFSADRLDTFVATAWASMPIVVALQITALLAARAYRNWPGIQWLYRVVVGVITGTGLAPFVVAGLQGSEGISRGAFVADALLLSMAAVGWRGLWVVVARGRGGAGAGAINEPVSEMIDRAAEITTFRTLALSLYIYRELLRNLVVKDLKLKYRGSVFGFLWSLANPLLMMIVYTVAFTYILRVRSEGFVFCLMLGLLSWTFFANSAVMSTGAIVENSGLLKSVLFPRAILPISSVLFNLAQYLLTVAVFLPALMLWFRIGPSAPMVLFPVFLLLQVVFTIGIALILATATAFFRDVRHLLEVALAVLFWTTPILYRLEDVPDRLQLFLLLSPMSPFVVAYQQLFFFGDWPVGAIWLMASMHAGVTFIVGGLLFLASESRFTEQI